MPARTPAKLLLWGSLRLVLFSRLQQLARRQFEELGDVEHGSQGRALLSAFHLPDIAKVVAQGMREVLLSHAALCAQLRYHPTESFLRGVSDAFNGCSDRSGHMAIVRGSTGL